MSNYCQYYGCCPRFRIIILASIISVLAFTFSAWAEETEIKHRLGAFLGATADGADWGESFGLEYENFFAPHLGAGVLAEYAGGDFDIYLVGVPFFIHPYEGLFFRFAPMLEFGHGDTEVVGRLGIGWDFELTHHWLLAPEFNLDLNRRKRAFTQVFGLAVSYQF